MILLDANLLIYAYDPAAANHRRARAWLEFVLSSDEIVVGIPLQTIGAFLRITTQVGLPGARLSLTEAVEIVDDLFSGSKARLLSPGEAHWPQLREVLLAGKVSGRLVTDAQLAALAMECDAILCTTDRDFSRFPGLRWENPLLSV